MTRFRALLLALAAAVAMAGVGLTAAQASPDHWLRPAASSQPVTVHGAPLVQRAGCAGSVNYHFQAARPQGETQWDRNPDNCWQRTALGCRNPLNQKIVWVHSPWYRSRAVASVSCNTLEPVVYGGVDTGHQAGSPYVYHQLRVFTKTAHLTAFAAPPRHLSIRQQIAAFEAHSRAWRQAHTYTTRRITQAPYQMAMAADNTFRIHGNGLSAQPDIRQGQAETLCSQYFAGIDGHRILVCNEPTHCFQGTAGTYVFTERCAFVTGQFWADIGRDHVVDKNLGQSVHYGHTLVLSTHGIGAGEDIDLGDIQRGVFYNWDLIV